MAGCERLVEAMSTALVAYFAHDLCDPAVERRIRMLEAGGAEVRLIGFRRGPEMLDRLAKVEVFDLGRTTDGKLGQRAASIAHALFRLQRCANHVRGADVVLARNLEMLIIASRARSLYAPRAALVYECLDIHRLLLSKGIIGRLLNILQRRLWQGVDLLLTSSPAFIRNYFAPRHFPAPIRLVENKVVLLGGNGLDREFVRRPPGPPWRIGWFGALRCRKTFEVLSALAKSSKGAVEVVIRGRPSDAVFSRFAGEVAGVPHLSFLGPYNYPDGLPSIYADVHFAWAIDYYERGQNSTWLLPNRIYEATLFGVVPMALNGVETGRWLSDRAAGVVLNEPLETELSSFFRDLSPVRYTELAKRMEAIPREDLVYEKADCRALVQALRVRSVADTSRPPAHMGGDLRLGA
jgi:succinoglycan biosynthesis protein ExoL